MLDLHSLDLDEIATALAGQESPGHRWLVEPATGDVALWTAEDGIDGHNPVDIDDLDLVGIDPLPSYVWYQDMADFAEASRGGAPSATSVPSCTRSTRTWSRRGTTSAAPAPSSAPLNGWWTTTWSTSRRPSGS
jgi:hypothetical protein